MVAKTMVFPQPLLIGLCSFLPIYLIYFKRRHDCAVAWASVTISLDIFNSQAFMNLPAICLFGAVAAPYLWQNRPALLQSRPIQIFGVYFLLLTALGLYMGYINPWIDPTGLRTIKDQAQVRSVLHLGRTFCEALTILYLSYRLKEETDHTLQSFLKPAFICGIALVVSTALEKAFALDFYHFFTGGRALLIEERPRGLTYEPRGLSQNLVYIMLLTPFVNFGRWRLLFIPVFVAFAFFVTVSFTGFLILGAGCSLLLIATLIARYELVKQHKIKFFIGLGSGVFAISLFLNFMPDYTKVHFSERMKYFFASDIAEKFEVFDAAAVNFFEHNPKYLALGAGPGLVYLPAGEYIIPRDRPTWGNHFEALPHVGAILTISNGGILGLLMCMFALGYALILSRKRHRTECFILGLTLCGLYFLQIKYFGLFGLACLISSSLACDTDSFLTPPSR